MCAMAAVSPSSREARAARPRPRWGDVRFGASAVTKLGGFAPSPGAIRKLTVAIDREQHMVDAHVHLSIETKDEDLKGCRILETQKNRFGGAGHVVFLDLHRAGFREVARVCA